MGQTKTEKGFCSFSPPFHYIIFIYHKFCCLPFYRSPISKYILIDNQLSIVNHVMLRYQLKITDEIPSLSFYWGC